MQEHFEIQPRVVSVGSDEDGMHLIDGRLELVLLLRGRKNEVMPGTGTCYRVLTVRSITNTIAANSFHWIGNF